MKTNTINNLLQHKGPYTDDEVWDKVRKSCCDKDGFDEKIGVSFVLSATATIIGGLVSIGTWALASQDPTFFHMLPLGTAFVAFLCLKKASKNKIAYQNTKHHAERNDWEHRDLHALRAQIWKEQNIELSQYCPLNVHELKDLHEKIQNSGMAVVQQAWQVMLSRINAPIRREERDLILAALDLQNPEMQLHSERLKMITKKSDAPVETIELALSQEHLEMADTSALLRTDKQIQNPLANPA